MLNVPEAVKTLFQTDGVQKNFRVHFPDGENQDLTNTDIVAGSVKFTESVCSKEVLQFGLAEASRIEFECVGVPNIYGATIECYCEIDTSSLSSEYQTTKADLDYPVYSVPYGSFVVRSCPRNAEGMWKRRVEAYAMDYGDTIQLSALTRKKLNYASQTGNEFALNPYAFYAGERGDLSGLTYTQTSVNYTTATNTGVRTWIGIVGTTQYFLVQEEIVTLSYSVYQHPSSLFQATCTYNDAGYRWLKSNVPSNLTISDSAKGRFVPYIRWGASEVDRYFTDDPTDTGIVYPYATNLSNTYMMYYTSSIKCHIEDDQGNVLTSTRTFTPCSNTSATRFDITGDISNLVLSFKPTYQNGTEYRYFDAVDFADIRNGLLEINAQFGSLGRDNTFKAIHLSKSSPVSMSTSEYSSLWWDEYDIAPIGSIKVTYYDLDMKQDQTIIYQFGDGLSEYEMTDNYLLKHLAVSANDLTNQTVQEYVQTLLDAYFIPNITDIAFTPVDLDALGLPYLEAGDYLEVEAEDGTTVGTYIMMRTLSGEQYLEDSIESKGGEIVGSDVRST